MLGVASQFWVVICNSCDIICEMMPHITKQDQAISDDENDLSGASLL